MSRSSRAQPMLCPRCGTNRPERAGTCAACGQPFPIPQESDSGAKSESRSNRPVSSAQRRSRNADGERIARLMQEAAEGYSRPTRTPPASREEEEDEIIRDFLSRIFEVNRRTIQQTNDTDREALATLYTAKSFSSPEAMGRATGAVRQLLHVNRRVEGDMRRAFDRVNGRVESAKWTSLEKALFRREMTEGFSSKFQSRSQAIEIQEAWTTATAEVYEFALCHSDQLRFEGKTVHASDQEVGLEFIEKLKRAKQYRDEFRRATARIQQEQTAVLIEWGVTEPPVP